MATVRSIALILGGEPVLKRRVRSVTELRLVVEKGLPKSTLERTVRHVVTDRSEARQFIDRIVSPATYKRRKTLLKPDESEKVARLARIIATAEEVWGNPEDARRFLTSPHAGLGGERPLDLAQSELGAQEVEEELWKLMYGLPA